jgi:hypothetical protein
MAKLFTQRRRNVAKEKVNVIRPKKKLSGTAEICAGAALTDTSST